MKNVSIVQIHSGIKNKNPGLYGQRFSDMVMMAAVEGLKPFLL